MKCEIRFELIFMKNGVKKEVLFFKLRVLETVDD